MQKLHAVKTNLWIYFDCLLRLLFPRRHARKKHNDHKGFRIIFILDITLHFLSLCCISDNYLFLQHMFTLLKAGLNRQKNQQKTPLKSILTPVIFILSPKVVLNNLNHLSITHQHSLPCVAWEFPGKSHNAAIIITVHFHKCVLICCFLNYIVDKIWPVAILGFWFRL